MKTAKKKPQKKIAKKAPTRKRASQTRPAPETVEVAKASATAATERLKRQASAIEKNLDSIKDLPAYDLVLYIRNFVRYGDHVDAEVDGLQKLARVARWAAGHALIKAKDDVGHGGWEKWLSKNRSKLGFSKSSAENYMRMARDFQDVESLLADDRCDREIYYGNSGEEESDPGEHTDEDAPSATPPRSSAPTCTEALLRALTELQKRLRHLAESEEKLEDDQLVQLRLVKAEIDRFFTTIAPSKS